MSSEVVKECFHMNRYFIFRYFGVYNVFILRFFKTYVYIMLEMYHS